MDRIRSSCLDCDRSKTARARDTRLAHDRAWLSTRLPQMRMQSRRGKGCLIAPALARPQDSYRRWLDSESHSARLERSSPQHLRDRSSRMPVAQTITDAPNHIISWHRESGPVIDLTRSIKGHRRECSESELFCPG